MEFESKISHRVLQRLSYSINTKCSEVHFGQVQPIYRLRSGPYVMKYSAYSVIAVYLTESSSIYIYMSHLSTWWFCKAIPQRILPVCFCSCYQQIPGETKQVQKLFYCSVIASLRLDKNWAAACSLTAWAPWESDSPFAMRRGKKALFLPFLPRFKYVYQLYLSLLRQDCKKRRCLVTIGTRMPILCQQKIFPE